jgi:hypothetical protein
VTPVIEIPFLVATISDVHKDSYIINTDGFSLWLMQKNREPVYEPPCTEIKKVSISTLTPPQVLTAGY